LAAQSKYLKRQDLRMLRGLTSLGLVMVMVLAALAGCGKESAPTETATVAPGDRAETATPKSETASGKAAPSVSGTLELFVPCAFNPPSVKIIQAFKVKYPDIEVAKQVENVEVLAPRIGLHPARRVQVLQMTALQGRVVEPLANWRQDMICTHLIAAGLTLSALLIPVCIARAEGGPEAGATAKLVVSLPHVLGKVFGDLKAAFERSNAGVTVVGDAGLVDEVVDQVAAKESSPDLFLSIGIRELETLRKRGRLVVGSLREWAVTTVSVLVVKGNPLNLTSLDDLAKPDVKVSAIPAPKFNSAGAAFVAGMKHLGLWDKIKGKILTKPIPKYATALVEQNTGAEACVTYSSCYTVGHAKTTHLLAVMPAEGCRPIACAAVLVTGSSQQELGRRFLDFLTSDEAQGIWEKWGYQRLATKG